MQKQETVTNNTKQLIRQFLGFIKNPLETNISFIHYEIDVFAETNAPLFQSFLIKYQNPQSINEIFKLIEVKTDIWEILNINERNKIISILKDNKLSERANLY